jgi:hypothetical protein
MTTSQSTETPSFEDLLREHGHVPSYETTGELIRSISLGIYDEEPSWGFSDVRLSFSRVLDFEVEQVEYQPRTVAKIKPTIGFHPFWYPYGAPVPSLDFRYEDEEGSDEWQSEFIHPRVVSAGREAIMKHTASWLYHEIGGAESSLGTALRKLQAIRDADDPFRWGAPQCFHSDPGRSWEDAGGDGRIPSVGSEPTDMKVKMLD